MFAPIPSASVSTATAVKPGLRRRTRTPYRTSCQKLAIRPPCRTRDGPIPVQELRAWAAFVPWGVLLTQSRRPAASPARPRPGTKSLGRERRQTVGFRRAFASRAPHAARGPRCLRGRGGTGGIGLRQAAAERARRPACAFAAESVRESDARPDPSRRVGLVPAHRAGRGAVPEARGRSRRAADAAQARHAGRVRGRALRADPHARRRLQQPRDPGEAPAGWLRRRHRVGCRRPAVCVPKHLEGCRRAMDRRRRHRRDPATRRRPAQPDAGQLAAMDARPEDPAREARAGQRRAASCGGSRVGRPEHPGDDRRDRREQHLRNARHALEQARRGPLRLLRDQPARLRRRGLGPDQAAGRPGDHHAGRPLARRRAHPRRHDPQAVLVRDHVPELRARRGALGPRRPPDAYASRSCPSRIACRSPACRPARAISSGVRPNRRRSSGPRRSMAATGTSASPRATRS